MRFGIFPVEGGDTWDGVVEQCQLAEQMGFESCWVNDHQATEGDNYWPSPLSRLTSIATGTESLEVVTSVLILPLYHPLHVAQRAAMLDNISGGRLTLGVGLGYVEEEFEAFGVPMDERAGRMIEGIKFIDEFFSSDEPVSFDCPFFTVEDWEPLPQTIQDPRPSLWIGGWGDRQIHRSVSLSDAWVPGVVGDLQVVETRKEKQRELVEESGQVWSEMDHPLMREAVIAETEEEVQERKQYLHRTYVEEYGGEFSHPLMTADSVEDFHTLADDRFIYGTPEQIIEQIASIRERFPLNQLTLRFHHSGMPKELVEKQIRLFGEEVIPEFD
jgi:alkanesulfonate monooxygenase SsuD/methylene tetrahydromethanopterin reductase-like flavin-dependent oxidoreductase (luciferase family)